MRSSRGIGGVLAALLGSSLAAAAAAPPRPAHIPKRRGAAAGKERRAPYASPLDAVRAAKRADRWRRANSEGDVPPTHIRVNEADAWKCLDAFALKGDEAARAAQAMAR